MLSETVKNKLEQQIKESKHRRELMIDVMTAFQESYGYLSDEAIEAASEMLNMNPVELEELATFYTFLYREPVGKYVIHICDSVVCYIDGYIKIRDYLCRKLDIEMGQTTKDGLFTLLPACCLGYCDRSPAILINRKVYGPLTTEKIDEIIQELKAKV